MKPIFRLKYHEHPTYHESLQGYSAFYQMCDAIEGAAVNGTSYTEGDDGKGVGLKKALPNYAKWYTANYLPGCK